MSINRTPIPDTDPDVCWRCGDTRGPHQFSSRGVQCYNAEACDERYEQRKAERQKERETT